jgi:hypothetical protein
MNTRVYVAVLKTKKGANKVRYYEADSAPRAEKLATNDAARDGAILVSFDQVPTTQIIERFLKTFPGSKLTAIPGLDKSNKLALQNAEGLTLHTEIGGWAPLSGETMDELATLATRLMTEQGAWPPEMEPNLHPAPAPTNDCGDGYSEEL